MLRTPCTGSAVANKSFVPNGRANEGRVASAARPSYIVKTMSDPVLTPAAAQRVRLIADKQGAPAMLRLGVDGGGCAGFTYRFELGTPEDGDIRTETDGVTLLVDSISLDFLKGSAVDFVENLGGASFQVTNPNAQSGCGCGSSFSI